MSSNAHSLRTGPHQGALSTGHTSLEALKGLWSALWAARARRGTVTLLRSLDNRTLQDIGVERSEIESLVYGRSGDRVRAYRSR